MGTTTLIALAVAALAMVAVAVLALLLVGERRRTSKFLVDSRSEHSALRRRVDELAERVACREPEGAADFVITDIGLPAGSATAETPVVGRRMMVDATLGEPLLKAATFAFGVRRALSAESRNRIRFEMRRETRRARKVRRQEMKQAWRAMRAQEPAP